VSVDNKTWHRVRIGPFTDRQSLNVTRRRLKENDIEAITLKASG
jgi:cell division protein FtsN